MNTTIRWDTHERDLLPLLDILADDVPPTPLLACFHDGEAGWMLLGRAERADDEVDPVTELAVVAAEARPHACVIATPVRVRDLADEAAPPIARTWVLLSAVLHDRGADLRSRMLPVDGLGVASDLEVEESPAASVLDDALRHRLRVGPLAVIDAACRWGNELMVPAGVDVLPRALVEAREGATAVGDVERTRHRLQRHAVDLAARHRPTAPAQRSLDRPAVHADTPAGWLVACPL